MAKEATGIKQLNLLFIVNNQLKLNLKNIYIDTQGFSSWGIDYKLSFCNSMKIESCEHVKRLGDNKLSKTL